MMYLFSTFNLYSLIWIAIPSLVLLIFFLIYLLNSKKEVIKASDGTKFLSKRECESYEASLTEINNIFNSIDSNPSFIQSLGIDLEFIKTFKNKGFSDVNSVMKYRSQIKLISEILNKSIEVN